MIYGVYLNKAFFFNITDKILFIRKRKERNSNEQKAKATGLCELLLGILLHIMYSLGIILTIFDVERVIRTKTIKYP